MSMRLTHTAALLFLLPAVALTTPAHAQQPAAPAASPPAAPTPSPDALKEAESMADLLNIPLETRNIVQNTRNQLIQSTMAASGKPVDEAAKIVDEVMMPDFNAAVPGLSKSLLLPWAINFSADDLKALHAFYLTPAGQNFLKKIGMVGQETARVSQAWSQQTFNASKTKHADELRARGLKF
jgi:hypothetical protein